MSCKSSRYDWEVENAKAELRACLVKILSQGVGAIYWGSKSHRSCRWAHCIRKPNPKLDTGNYTGPKPREVPKHKRRKEQVGAEPRKKSAECLSCSHINYLCHKEESVHRLHFETQSQKQWWILTYPQRRKLIVTECLLFIRHWTRRFRYIIPRDSVLKKKKFFFSLSWHTQLVCISQPSCR